MLVERSRLRPITLTLSLTFMLAHSPSPPPSPSPGALATLMAGEIARGIDPQRGFKTREDDSWLAQAQRFAARGAQEASIVPCLSTNPSANPTQTHTQTMVPR